jgi:hypothetical protein
MITRFLYFCISHWVFAVDLFEMMVLLVKRGLRAITVDAEDHLRLLFNLWAKVFASKQVSDHKIL